MRRVFLPIVLGLVGWSGHGMAADAERGRAIVMNRQVSACLLCHAGPFPEPHLQGNVGPPLNGVGSRLQPDELRLRLTEPARFNPETVMPSYGPVSGLNRVGRQWIGKTVLTPDQIEDVVTFLATLRDP